MLRFASIPFCFILTCLLLNSCQGDPKKASLAKALPQKVDFNYHIKPLLSDRCFKCHGPDNNARKAELRLDIAENALSTKLETGGYAFVPKSLGKSKAYQRIIASDPELVMPPPDSHLSLTEEEKALIRRWIKQGAEYKQHWSFIPPKKAALPDISALSASDHPIDRFITEKVIAKGLNLKEEASKETLIRRLSFDLRGLPPSIEEVDAFLADDSSDAYEKLVDQLLASPHFGERLALDWLDLARYADSHGYQDDGMRNTWPWRDWVIEAFNKNLSYDQFIVWQLAGDLLPNPTDEQLLATCFNRNHPQTQEGGVVDEEYRIEYVADRTNTFGKAFLGLTMECARCHDHKYDPITQKEYYSLFAFFNNNNDTGIVPYNGEASPTLILPSPEAQQKMEQLQQDLAPLEAALVPDQYVDAFRNWHEDGATNGIRPLTKDPALLAYFHFEKEKEINVNAIYLDRLPRPKRKKSDQTTYAYYNAAKQKMDANNWGHKDERPQFVKGKKGNAIKFIGDGGIRFNRDLDFDRHQPFSVSIWIQLLKQGEFGPVFNNTNGDFEGYRGWLCKLNEDGTLSFQFNHVWPDNCIDIKTLHPLEINKWTHIGLTYDGSSKADGIKIFIDGKIPSYRIIKDNLKKSLLHGIKGSNWSDHPFILGMELRQSIQNIVMDELMVFNRQLSGLEMGQLFSEEMDQADVIAKAIESTSLQKEQLLEYYLLSGVNPDFNQNLKKATNIRKKINLLITDQPEVMIMQERAELRSTFILDRGAYDAPIEEVQPTIPASIMQLEEGVSPDRLGLARWLTDQQNPLTARVVVNRFWTMCFGKGLVGTQEDFGNQGNLPSHPELLDWLAVDFMEKGWDVKGFFKMMVMSDTYRRSSIPSEKAKEEDPDNTYYSHYPAHRLTAEFIRDNALAASGLLVSTIGGPSVYPYQPDGIWAALATRNETRYIQQHGDSLYRRSMYTVWKRSSPPPSMLNFDAPDRYYCVVRRQNTATPLQSLVLMNDPQYLEAARVLGERMIREAGSTIDQRITLAYKALTSRAPNKKELAILKELYQEERNDFEQHPERVVKWLNIGEYPVDQTLDQNDLAACAVVASTIMNFDEFIVKR